MRACITRAFRGLILAAPLLLGACAAELPPEELLERAETALAAGEYQAAFIDARSALQVQPDNPGARRVVGEVELWRQRPSAAVDEFERALRSGKTPELLALYAEALVRAGELEAFDSLVLQNYFGLSNELPEYLAPLARAQAARGDLSFARRTVAGALRTNPDNLELRLAEAEITAIGGDIDDALGLLEDLVTTSGASARAWSLLGQLYSLRRNYPDAVAALEKAIAANPNRYTDRLRYASALLKNRDLEQAREVIADLSAKNSESPGLNLLAAELQFLERDIDGALISINKVLNVAPREPAALYLSGIINSQAGNLETARRHLSIFLTIKPEQMSALARLAGIQLALEQPQLAADSARKVLENSPMNTSAARTLAAALAMLGDQAGSVEAFGRVMELNPESTAAAAGYGSALARSGDLDAAAAQLEVARGLDPASVEIRARLATVLLAKGEPARATAETEAFVRDYPDNPEAHALAGTVARSAGDAEGARRHFEAVLELEANSVSANTALAALAVDAGDMASAKEFYEQILEERPDDLQTLLRMAMLSESTGDLAAMEAQLQNAIAQHPQALEPRAVLARYQLSQQRFQDVLSALMPVRQSSLGQPLLHELLAQAYLGLSRYSSALEESQQLVEAAPNSPAGLLLQAQSQVGLGELADAEASLRKAGELSDSPVIKERLMTVLVNARKFEAARAELESLPPGAFAPWQYEFVLGRIAESSGDYADAAAAFARSLNLESLNSTLVRRSNALWLLGDQAEAISELYGWLDENPEDTLILSHLANLHLSVGESEPAQKLFERLDALQPGNPVILNNLAWSSRNEDPERSLALIERARELLPDDVGIEDTYSMVLLANGDAEAALQLNNRLQGQYPERADLTLHGAEILVALGRSGEAETVLDKMIAEGELVRDAQALKDTLSP